MEMNTQVKNTVQTPVGQEHNNLNFDLWAKEVKVQLIAALKKRGEK